MYLFCIEGLFIKGVSGRLGTKNLMALCYIKDFENWNFMNIIRKKKPVMRLSSKSKTFSRMNKKAVDINAFSVRKDSAQLGFTFSKLRCKDEEKWSCNLDGNFTATADIIVSSTYSVRKGVKYILFTYLLWI